MFITKRHIKILKIIYKKGSVSYLQLNKKCKEPLLMDQLEQLLYNHYVDQINDTRNVYGEPIPIKDDTLFKLTDSGCAEVESKQWFNMQFVLLQIILPMVIAIVTTLITIFLPALLSPFL